MKSRISILVFGLFAGLLAPSLQEAQAQKKNNDADLAKAKAHAKDLERKIDQLEATIRKLKGDDKSDDKRVGELQKDVQERNQRIAQLEATIRKLKGDDNSDDARIAQLRRELQERDARIQQLLNLPKGANEPQTATLQKDVERLNQHILDLKKAGDARAVHSTFYRLKKGEPASAANAFLDGTPKALGKLPGVRGIWVGRASAPGDDDKAFDVGIVAVFDDAESLRRFVGHPAYRSHVDSMKKSWEPLIYNLSRE